MTILKSYLKFLYNSKNQHGVHSPFVFNLVTKCFYDKKYYPEYNCLKSKQEKLIFRIEKYFDQNKIIKIDHLLEMKRFEENLGYISNDSLIIIKNIHQSKLTEENWNKIKNNPKVTVTIDTFYLGIIFFRKEQKKEHFVVRV